MSTLVTSVIIIRWQLISALLMFTASTLKIQLRRAEYYGLAAVAGGLGIAASCWFATGLLGLSLSSMTVTVDHIKDVMVNALAQMPENPAWAPM